MTPIPLEDSFADILGKAIRGTKTTAADVANRAGVQIDQLQALLDGTWDNSTASKVAPLLSLDPAALKGLAEGTYLPLPITLQGLAQYNTVFDDMTVNAYVVYDEATRQTVIFDTGADASGMLDLVQERGLAVKAILLTHTHGDHIYDLDRLASKTGAPAFVGNREPLDGAESFAAGRTWEFGPLRIESRLTWGHSPGGITFVVQGLARPVAIVGDSIFAGSMGGGGISYPDALRNNREQILTLPDETILCPGHGPMAALGEQRVHNPFFAGAGN